MVVWKLSADLSESTVCLCAIRHSLWHLSLYSQIADCNRDTTTTNTHSSLCCHGRLQIRQLHPVYIQSSFIIEHKLFIPSQQMTKRMTSYNNKCGFTKIGRECQSAHLNDGLCDGDTYNIVNLIIVLRLVSFVGESLLTTSCFFFLILPHSFPDYRTGFGMVVVVVVGGEVVEASPPHEQI
jgi:hypothetical protein